VTSELRAQPGQAQPGEAWVRDEGQRAGEGQGAPVVHPGRHRRAPEARSSYREVFAIGEFRALWTLAGAGGAYQLAAAAAFVQALRPDTRARAFGVAQSGLYAVQGLGILAGGAVAQLIGAPLSAVWPAWSA
jgi:MFS family permease